VDEPRVTKQIAQPSESGPFEKRVRKQTKLHAKKSTPFSLMGSSCASLRQNKSSSCSRSRQNEHFTRPAGPHLYKPPEQAVHGRTSTALALPVLVCTSLRKKLSSELVAGVSADFLPATNRPQHRRQRCCGRFDLPMLAFALNAGETRSRRERISPRFLGWGWGQPTTSPHARS